jgi:hypothetical protein
MDDARSIITVLACAGDVIARSNFLIGNHAQSGTTLDMVALIGGDTAAIDAIPQWLDGQGEVGSFP